MRAITASYGRRLALAQQLLQFWTTGSLCKARTNTKAKTNTAHLGGCIQKKTCGDKTETLFTFRGCFHDWILDRY